MTRHSSLIFACLMFLAGCAAVTKEEESRRVYGVVTESRTTSERVERPGQTPYGQIGGVGGIAQGEAAKSGGRQVTMVNRLFLKTAAGEVIVDFDEFFVPGTCVEVTPKRGVASSNYYPFGTARVARAGKC